MLKTGGRFPLSSVTDIDGAMHPLPLPDRRLTHVVLRRFAGPLGEGDHLALPADFLVDDIGAIVALKYGAHADDQWSVDDVLDLASRARTA